MHFLNNVFSHTDTSMRKQRQIQRKKKSANVDSTSLCRVRIRFPLFRTRLTCITEEKAALCAMAEGTDEIPFLIYVQRNPPTFSGLKINEQVHPAMKGADPGFWLRRATSENPTDDPSNTPLYWQIYFAGVCTVWKKRGLGMGQGPEDHPASSGPGSRVIIPSPLVQVPAQSTGSLLLIPV